MAITATLLTSLSDGWDTAADQSVTSASITPGTNCGLVALMYGVADHNAAISLFGGDVFSVSDFSITSSGSGPSWTAPTGTYRATPANNFDAHTCIMVAAIGGTSPGTFTVTIDFPDTRVAGQIVLAIYKITGHDTTTPFAGTLCNTRTGGTGNGAQSITLGATPGTGDVVLAISGADTAGASDAVFDNTARTWTRDATGGTSGHQIAFAVGQSTGSTSTTVAWSDVNEDDGNNFSSAQGAIIVKVASAAVVGTMAPTQGADVADIDGTNVPPAFVGTIAKTQASDTSTITGNVVGPGDFVGTISKTQASDTADIDGTVVNFYVGRVVATQGGDLGDLNGTVVNPGITGRIAVTQAGDIGDLTGSGQAVAYPATKSGRKWLDQFGRNIQIRTLSSWGMVQRLSNADITTAVANAANRGFNALTVDISAGMNLGSGWNPNVNSASGLAFWTGTAFQSTLGPAWSHITHLMNELTARGMYLIASCYTANGNQSTTKLAMAAATASQVRTTGQRWATALASWNNWIIHYGSDDVIGADAKFDSLVQGIQDIRGPILCVGEPTHGQDALNQWPVGTFAFADMEEALYNYATNSVEVWEATYQGDPRTPDGPVWDCEPLYIGHGAGGNQGQEKRYRHYTVVIEGGLGLNNGHEDWWTFGAVGVGYTNGETWPTAMNNVIIQDFQRSWTIWDLCNTTAWDATNSFIVVGEGAANSKAAQGTSGLVAMAYFPDGRTVQVDTTIITGTGNVRLRWFDPSTGAFTLIAASEAQNSGRSVTMPAARGDGTRDFILVVDQSDSGASINAFQQNNVADIDGTFQATRVGTIAVTQAGNTADIDGTVLGPPRTGTIAATQADNLGDLNGNVSSPGSFVGTIHPTQAGNVADLNGTFATGVPPIKSGVNTVGKIYAGSNQVSKVYLGSTQL